MAVAADGAGTSERAPEGARLACEAVLQRARRWAARPGGPLDLRPRGLPPLAGRGPGADRARPRGPRQRESRDFSCTLLVALVGEARAVFFQIGDGAIVYRGADGAYVPALWPQTGEYANCTWFVTDDDAAERVQSAAAEGVARGGPPDGRAPGARPALRHPRGPRPVLRADVRPPAPGERGRARGPPRGAARLPGLRARQPEDRRRQDARPRDAASPRHGRDRAEA